MTPRETDPPGPTRKEPTGRAGAISRFFIERPVLANVIALVVVLIGLVALFNLPSSQYPNVVPPTVQVTTRYPGASARTLVNSVALPIEQKVNGVENMLYMQSTSADDGTYTLTVTFAIGTNPDLAQSPGAEPGGHRLFVAAAGSAAPGRDDQEAVDLDSRIRRAELSRQPLRQPVPVELRRHQCPGRARRLNGVGDVSVLGAGQYAMRVWLNPNLLQARGLTPQDVINIIQQQSQEVTAGQIGAPPAPRRARIFSTRWTSKAAWTIRAEFENIIVKVDPRRTADGSPKSATSAAPSSAPRPTAKSFNLDGRPAAGIAVSLLPEANAIAVSNEVKAKMDELAKSFPEGLVYGIPYDTTKFVQGRDRRSLSHADRGRHSGADRHPRLPAGLAGDAGAGDHRAGDAHRRVRRDGGPGLFDQSPDAVRPPSGNIRMARPTRRACRRTATRSTIFTSPGPASPTCSWTCSATTRATSHSIRPSSNISGPTSRRCWRRGARMIHSSCRRARRRSSGTSRTQSCASSTPDISRWRHTPPKSRRPSGTSARSEPHFSFRGSKPTSRGPMEIRNARDHSREIRRNSTAWSTKTSPSPKPVTLSSRLKHSESTTPKSICVGASGLRRPQSSASSASES